jgi:hypothetical protein
MARKKGDNFMVVVDVGGQTKGGVGRNRKLDFEVDDAN